MNLFPAILNIHKSLFNSDKVIAIQSPSRINLIGEHTDYNFGLVLPAAIDRYIFLIIGKRKDNEVHLFSVDFDQAYTFDLSNIQKADWQWANYVIGTLIQILARYELPSGFNITFGGDIPIGAGLSSSAALSCAVGSGINELFGLRIQKFDLAKIAQRAENEFVGVKCGIMDQFASMFGKKDHVIKLDCHSFDYEYIPFASVDYTLLLIDSNVKHNLAESNYNSRTDECNEGLTTIQKKYPQIQYLSEATSTMIERSFNDKNNPIYKRCKYVAEENIRVKKVCLKLIVSDFVKVGKLLFETHKGLSRDFEVSCPELDFLVDEAYKNKHIIGARMMGGGFGGCTINIVHTDKVQEVTKHISASYSNAFGKEPHAFPVSLSNGNNILSHSEITF